jgi:hypothetical protein
MKLYTKSSFEVTSQRSTKNMMVKYKFLWWKYRSRSTLPNPQVLGDLSGGVERSSKVNGGQEDSKKSCVDLEKKRLFYCPSRSNRWEQPWPVVPAWLGWYNRQKSWCGGREVERGGPSRMVALAVLGPAPPNVWPRYNRPRRYQRWYR